MPDDLQIPVATAPNAGRPSYRMDRPARGLDAGTVRLLVFAGAALLVLLFAVGTWAWVGRKPAGVPVIEADSRPLRVKPENPGGMQIAGADEPDDAAPNLAPAPEAPAPLALRAQVQANRPPPAPTPVPATPAPSTAAPLADAPPTPASAARPAALPAPAAPRAAQPAATGPVVQLAALESEDAARAEWGRLQKRFPEMLGARQPTIQRTEKDGKTLWRIRTGPFTDFADATGFCAKLRAKGAACALGTF